MNFYKIVLIIFFSSIGTIIGGYIGIKLRNKSDKIIKKVINITKIMMMYIVCFNLIPEAINNCNIYSTIIWTIIGIIIIYIFQGMLEEIAYKNIGQIEKIVKKEINNWKIRGINIAIAMIIHNFPEGFAIGSGIEESYKLGIEIAVAMCTHDIPEGIAMALPMKIGKIKNKEIFRYIMISIFSTLLGAIIGIYLNKEHTNFIGKSLSLAAGAMMYICFNTEK